MSNKFQPTKSNDIPFKVSYLSWCRPELVTHNTMLAYIGIFQSDSIVLETKENMLLYMVIHIVRYSSFLFRTIYTPDFGQNLATNIQLS